MKILDFEIQQHMPNHDHANPSSPSKWDVRASFMAGRQGRGAGRCGRYATYQVSTQQAYQRCHITDA
jgi:hypothetical protein